MDIDVEIRLLEARDSLTALTDLLHRAYASLAGMGLQYLATHQDVNTTSQRVTEGDCYVLFTAGRMIGTVVVSPPTTRFADCAWYDRGDVCVVSQFAIEPEYQRRGLGGRLLDFAETRASALGARESALDTAESATHLIEFYTARGYRHVGDVQWENTNYRSVVLSKVLNASERRIR